MKYLKVKGIFGADSNTFPAFDTVGFSLSLADLELHGADFFTLLAADTFVFFKFELIPFSSEQALGCSHRAERTPGSRAKESSEKNCN